MHMERRAGIIQRQSRKLVSHGYALALADVASGACIVCEGSFVHVHVHIFF